MGATLPSPSPSSGLGGVLRRLPRRALDALLPPQCLGCGALVDEPGSLCAECWDSVVFLGPPQCPACGFPFEYSLGEGALCGACSRRRPAFARWLARAGGELLGEAECIVPVPLHWSRLFARRYNQAALLAQNLGRLGSVPVVPDALVRRRRTPPQGRMGTAARRRNLAGAFAVGPRGRARIEGRRVLLVDDVLTTGATAAACGRTLLGAGAGAVDVLTLARVVRPAP